jgi:hypothetical protein
MSDAPANEALEYAIRRLNWRRTHYGIVRMPGWTPVGALPSFEEAEDDRARREAEVRARITNPFVCGPNHAARSRLPEPIFCDWLRDAGIEPPAEQPVSWVEWWEQSCEHFGAEQVAHVWGGLDRVRFFEVVARPEGQIAYAVVSIEWMGADQLFPGPEGGTPLKVFRRCADAEAYYRESEEEVRRVRDPATYCSINRWEEEPFWPLGPTERRLILTSSDQAPYYEVVEVELPDALARGDDVSPWQVFVVARLAWKVEPRGLGFTAFEPSRTDNPYGPDHRFVPVAAFAERDAAEVWMHERELEAARLFNPFWCVGPAFMPSGSCAGTRGRLKELVGRVPNDPFSAGKQAVWRAWWDEHVPTWSDETLAAVWGLFHSVRFYDVLEVDLG